MMDSDFGVMCLGCNMPMSVVAKDEFSFEAACPQCGSRTGFSFSGLSAASLVELGRIEVTRLMNEDLAIARGKVVRLDSSS